jgi:putative serine protease PepD
MVSAEARVWLVALASGVVGALVSAGILLATGVVGTSAPIVSSVEPSVQTTNPPAAQQSAQGVTAVLEMVEPSIVGLTVNAPQGVATGSGVIVSTAGDECYVLTDSTLFAETGPSSQTQVISSWGELENGHLLATDPSAGIAVVKVMFKALSAQDTANLGSVADIQSGEEVISVGSPSLTGASNGSFFSYGYISDTSSYLQPSDGASDAMFSMLVANMSVTSPAYGGALVNSSGQVLGITNPVSGQLAQAGLVYVTPIDIAEADVTWMISHGQAIAHPWFGILQATDIVGPGAQRFGVQGAVQVDTVASGSPAARAGIADNDIVTSINGRNVSSVGEMIGWLADARPGQVINVNWVHNGHRRKADLILGTQPLSASPS